MDLSERLRKAVEALGGKGRCQIVGAARSKGSKKKRARKLESFVRRRPEMTKAKYSQCAKKHRYRTQGDATKHMRLIQVIRPEKELRVYGPCPYCGGFHLTSKPIRKKCRIITLSL